MEARAPSRRVIVLLGMHRSGTSVLANVLSELGVSFGDRLIPGRADNERGFWEHAGIVAAHEDILTLLDRAWPGGKVSLPYPDGWWTGPDVAAVGARLRTILREEVAAAGGRPFGFKDPRICRLMPLWTAILNDLGLTMEPVLGLRHPLAVCRSLEKRDDLSPAQARLLWAQHTLEPLGDLGRMPPTVVFDDLVERPETVIAELSTALGLNASAEAVARARAVVADDLRHHRPAPDAGLPPMLKRVWDLLLTARAGDALPEDILALRRSLLDGQALFGPWADAVDRLTDPRLARRPLDVALLRDQERARWRREMGDRQAARPDPTPLPTSGPDLGRRRVCLVTPDFVGPVRNGGIGTACAALAWALANEGHDVTVLYVFGSYCEAADIAHWQAVWQARGVALVPLPAGGAVETTFGAETEAPRWSWWVHEWLAAHAPFDVIYAPEWQGVLYHALQARRAGSHRQDGALIVVGTHSPVLWHAEGNGDPVRPVHQAVDAMERACVALADVVVSPSRYLVDWMAARGWCFPPRVHVQQNLLPRLVPPWPTDPAPVRDIVFFGRLETRKGLLVFLEATAMLGAALGEDMPPVTFLGKHAHSGGVASPTLLAGHPGTVISDLDSQQAVSWLAEGGRLAVMPSLVENAPYTVMECLAAGVPFLAADVGGIAELIHPDDHSHVLFQPEPAALAEALRRALAGPPRRARVAVPPAETTACWLAWMRRAVMPPVEPARVEVLETAPWSELEMDGDTDLAGAARVAATPFLFLRAAGMIVRPEAGEHLWRAAVASGWDGVLPLAGTADGRPRARPFVTGAVTAGASGGHGLHAGALMVRRTALAAALTRFPAMPPDHAVALAGYRLGCLPEVLAWEPGALDGTAPLPALADGTGSDPTLTALRASTSWRVTAPLRRLLGAERPRSAAEILGSVWWDLAAPLRLASRVGALLRGRGGTAR